MSGSVSSLQGVRRGRWFYGRLALAGLPGQSALNLWSPGLAAFLLCFFCRGGPSPLSLEACITYHVSIITSSILAYCKFDPLHNDKHSCYNSPMGLYSVASVLHFSVSMSAADASNPHNEGCWEGASASPVPARSTVGPQLCPILRRRCACEMLHIGNCFFVICSSL